MDVVPDQDLYNFLDSIDTTTTLDSDTGSINNDASSPSSPSNNISNDNADSTDDEDIWEGIAAALDNWTQRILDAETRNSKSVNFRQRIEESLTRQQQDGFLSDNELAELRYITDLWQHLLHASSCYTVGCNFLKGDIIALLLDLHSARQISRSVFISTCLKL